MKSQTKTAAIRSPLTLGAVLCLVLLSGCSHNDRAELDHKKTQSLSEDKISNSPNASQNTRQYAGQNADQNTRITAHSEANMTVQGQQRHSPAPMLEMAESASMLVKTFPQPTMLQPTSADRFASISRNGLKRVSDDPVSTFSLDVDTGSYALVRRYLQHGQLPPPDAIRTEELINYFNYSYPKARDAAHPFAFDTELAAAPWNAKRQLLKVSLAAWQQPLEQLPASNLVFLVDVSGSMQAADKLPLLKSSLKLWVKQMRPQDTVALVTYAGQSAVVLEPTAGNHKAKIMHAIDSLGAGGGTHGAAGLKDAYRLAREHQGDGINRVLLATDGDFNVGLSDTPSLLRYIAAQRSAGISLTTLGFGQGNYNDELMEQLADKGDGNYAYIDTLSEARKVLMEQIGATLYTVAKDAKIQVEFNPARVSEYRLIGYENRLLQEQDFDNDHVDAGDIGAGHTVTALYEIALVDSGGAQLSPRRYSDEKPLSAQHSDELAWVKLRYKARGSSSSKLLQLKIREADLQAPSADLNFASAVARWSEWLAQPESTAGFHFNDIYQLALAAKGLDEHGYRSEFLQLMKLSEALR